MTIIEVTENKVEDMSECIEKILKYGEKLMTCLEQLKESCIDKKEDNKVEYSRYH